jgi:tetratricopeptide (TPR) repeat protein
VDIHLFAVGAAYAVAGRPELALAPLQRSVARYPNILGAHLALAVVYSELGQDVEARAEAAEVLRLNPHFSLEVHKQRMPIKNPAVVERQLAALRKAEMGPQSASVQSAVTRRRRSRYVRQVTSHSMQGKKLT